MRAEPVDFRDIQGLVRFGYSALTEASFLLLRIVMPRLRVHGSRPLPISTAEELRPAAIDRSAGGLHARGTCRRSVSRKKCLGDFPLSFSPV